MNSRQVKIIAACVAFGVLAWLPLMSAAMTWLIFGGFPEEPHWWSILVAAIPYWGRPEVADFQLLLAWAVAVVAAWPTVIAARVLFFPPSKPAPE